MKKEVADKWTKALRSGKYEQGTNYLVHADMHCCLGVLCKLAIKAGVKLKVETGQTGTMAFDGEEQSLPHTVVEWAGMSSYNGVYDDEASSLAILNDRLETFEHIAKLIEENWEAL